MAASERVAIVGVAARLPGSGADLARFWANVAAGLDCSEPVPDGRWLLPPSECLDPRPARPDSVYSDRGYFLDPFDPELAGLAVTRDFVAELDPLFQLVLDLGGRAFHQCQYEAVDRRRAGVVLGNICLPTEKASDLAREYLFAAQARPGGSTIGPTHPANRYVAGLPAGMLARALGFGGGSFTLDAACASSIYAIKLACDELLSHRADMMLAGGVSRPDALYTQMGFSQLRALSARGLCTPFDGRADGLMVGEGGGVFALKRLTDALHHEDEILGIVTGIGLSNDSHGNLLAPAKEGQLRAMRAAYRQAGWKVTAPDVIECHATGTPVGDAVEYESLVELWDGAKWQPGGCAIGSVKSTVGHLLTGAGAAALTKVLLAMREGQRPPQANFSAASPAMRDFDAGPFRVLSEPEAWDPKRPTLPRRAAVSGFGFGGVNGHLLVESYVGQGYSDSGVGRVSRLAPRSAQVTNPTPVSAAMPQSRILTKLNALIARTNAAGVTPVAQVRPDAPLPPEVPPEIAIVGLAAQVGPLETARHFQEAAFQPAGTVPARPLRANWDRATAGPPEGLGLTEVRVPLDRFRTPPRELAEALPQQILMLTTAAAALEDCLGEPAAVDPETGADDRTGVFIGLTLDPNTTNFHLRWAAKAAGHDPDAVGPPLTADRTMGALGSVAASRIARAFHFGGPAFTVCSEESGGLRALALAADALQNLELDRAVVGGVDLPGDPRAALAHQALYGPARFADGAGAVVLKRLTDATRDGDRVYAVLEGIGAAVGGPADKPGPDAAGYGSSLVRAFAAAGTPPNAADSFELATAGDSETGPLGLFLANRGRGLPARLSSLAAQLGHTGAAQGVLAVVKAAQSLYQQVLPAGLTDATSPHASRVVAPAFWLANEADCPRRAVVASTGVDGTVLHAILREEHPRPLDRHPHREQILAERAQPLGLRTEAIFALEGDDREALSAAITQLEERIARRGHVPIEQLAREWFLTTGSRPDAPQALAAVARTVPELAEQLAAARQALAQPDPESALDRHPATRDRVFTRSRPLGGAGKFAVVFPGSGNHYAGMGRALALEFPEALRRQQAENRRLREQYQPELFWGESVSAEATAQDFLFGQVALGTLTADILAALGVPRHAMLGQSLGESAGLFGLRVWRDRDEMLRRVHESTLFREDLGAPFKSARTQYQLGDSQAVDWLAGVLAVPAGHVRPWLNADRRVYLLIVATPEECVVGGFREDVLKLAAEFPQAAFLPLEGVTIAHCEAGLPVAGPYHELHTLPVAQVPGLTLYSGARAEPYLATPGHCADSITLGLTETIDFPAVVERAFSDGVRVFLEAGPGQSATRAVQATLAGRPHLARAVTAPRQPEVSLLLRTLAALVAERTGVTLEPLYAHPVAAALPAPASAAPRQLAVPVGLPPVGTRVPAGTSPPSHPDRPSPMTSMTDPTPTFTPPTARAQTSALLADGQQLAETETLEPPAPRQVVSRLLGGDDDEDDDLPAEPFIGGETVQDQYSFPRSLTTAQCFEFARGKIANVLGPLFAEVDSYPTRVRLPDGPLMLVDHVRAIEGEPRSLASGRVVTDHAVHADRWYLDAGRCPVSVTVESGQADLFLAGFLGIDFRTRGRAVYRLLDAVVTFHRELPRVGEEIVYDIAIDEFFQQGDSWLFRFRFEGTIDDRPLLTMQNGVAGFFTAEALAAGQGIVKTKLDLQRLPGTRPEDWPTLAPLAETTLTEDQVEALRQGDLVTAFGPEFARFENPQRLPGGMLRLLDRICELDPAGGRFGMGFVRGEYDLRPSEWFIECHFVDDKVMPGTLMYECCLHTMRVLLQWLGWVGTEGVAACDPVAGVNSRLKCRGQVLQSTRTVTYEITLKEFGTVEGEPYAIGDALMKADGRPIVEITNLSLKLSGVKLADLAAAWGDEPVTRTGPPPAFTKTQILAYSSGNPSEAFGEPYRVFDSDRVLARLPRPPFQFLDRVASVTGWPFVLEAGAACVAEYDVPRNAWYFAANRTRRMPFSVLLEAALQPCGFLAAYCGSALTSDVDLSFRNLGGQATQHRAVTPEVGMLTTAVTLTKTANAGGMVIQHYDLNVWDERGPVYTGTTYFGFFTKAALANQVGTPGAKLPAVTEAERKSYGYKKAAMPDAMPFPEPKYRMIDAIEYAPGGGSHGLGVAVGTISVDPSAWFFEAHFYQDPVWPGSLGLESFLQLLKFVAVERFGVRDYQTVALGVPHSWEYRGQVLPTDRVVQVHLEVTDEEPQAGRLTARGFLTVDGRIIYKIANFTLQ